MNTVQISIWGIAAALVLFVGIGVVLFVQALRGDRGGEPDTPREREGFAASMRRYVGPVRPEHAILNIPLRAGLELVCGSCGIPGMGWMMSTRVAIGLPLLSIVPSVVYGFYPVYLALSGHLLDSPLVALRYLPFLGVGSAALLLATELRARRQAR